ncbi:MAG TPA: gluconate 2-dehydrogenase subunit 3 family protein [Lutibacter sp.]|nr:gluconate 2-dehydrogenase subunit 3 family protein [Lutibacter sp.]
MKIKNRNIPRTVKDTLSWQVSRRNFIKNSLALGALTQMSILQSCINNENNTTVLNKKQMAIAIAVQNILFPKDKNGPGAIDFNADKYLLWVLIDQRIPKDENQYIINGLKWVDETAQEEMSQIFLKLSKKEQVQLIHTVSKTNWGESWLSVMLTFIFEAMISDPIYGFNKDEIGRRWLGHVAGFPRPTKENRYDEIFETLNNRQDQI